MLWLAAYLMGLPPTGLYTLTWTHGLTPMWSIAISAAQNNSIFPSFLHLILHSKSSCSPHMTAHFLQPLTGSLLFLWHPALPILACCYMTWCQCPQRAYSHFYCSKFFLRKLRLRVNALYGLTPISTVASRNP